MARHQDCIGTNDLKPKKQRFKNVLQEFKFRKRVEPQ